VHDEDVVAFIHGHADGAAQNPLVGQRLGPERVHLEVGYHARVAGGGGCLQPMLTDAERHEGGEGESGSEQEFLVFHEVDLFLF